MTDTLLIEIGTEELPPKALAKLSAVFSDTLSGALATAGFEFNDTLRFASPRRLAVQVTELNHVQPGRTEQRRGPALKAAFNADGEPSKAALGFARSCGVEVADLGRLKTEQGEWLVLEREVAGKRLDEVLGEMINAALAALPIPKRMRWGAGEVEFVRPAHWVVVMHGNEVIDCEVLGHRSGRTTRGHRFHHGGELELQQAGDYADVLEREGHVIASFERRRERIVELIEQARDDIGGEAEINPGLLDEVTALVEWPVIVAGSFDEHFLHLPEQCLVASMQDHQKYFPVRSADGSLINRFVTVSNIDSSDPDVVRDGNQRVIRPRLADADFFYHSDRARRLDSHLPALADMLFEKRLGSLSEKTTRVSALAGQIALACQAEPAQAARAATLSRCDLLSEMVGEFPELQGIMASYYAAADGESAAVSSALGEFYQPRFAGDDIARTPTGRAIAIADRLDTLVGIFGIGSAPTGDKDPYALRRAALGALRTLIEGQIDLDLSAALQQALAAYPQSDLAENTAEEVYNFMAERLRGYYLDKQIPADVCTAVLNSETTTPSDIDQRISAVMSFRSMDSASALAAANKRIANILRKLDTPVDSAWDAAYLSETAEQDLAEQLAALKPEIDQLFTERSYTRYLERLASLHSGVDRFFDEVMVMCDDLALRNNRLALLADLHRLFIRVADIAALGDA